MSETFLIYGATGYTGRLLARAAIARGLRPILSGRDEAKLARVSRSLGLSMRAAKAADLGRSLGSVKVVLNAAGPFEDTFSPVVDACLGHGAHYLDVTGEVAVIEGVAKRDEEARARGLMLMPAVGFDVVPSDCLALHVTRRLPRATSLRIAVTGLDLGSRGSLRTVSRGAGKPVLVRRDGVLVPVAPGSLQRAFDFGHGPKAAWALSWGDVATAHYTTGVPDITVYYEAIAPIRAMTAINQSFSWFLTTPYGRELMNVNIDMLPEGPTDQQRALGRCVVVAEAEDARGRVARSRVVTEEAYTFTCESALTIVERVLAGDFSPGFQTPARVYGADFATRALGAVREDLA